MSKVELKPGRELDALIAFQVMGLKLTHYELGGEPMSLDPGAINYLVPKKFSAWLDSEGALHSLPYYSTDIAAAWEVAEKMKLAVLPRTFDSYGRGESETGYWAGHLGYEDDIPGEANGDDGAYVESRVWGAFGETAPHAIALAALKAAGFEEKQ